MKAIKYEIRRIEWECECPSCGFPLDVGSTAWEWNTGGSAVEAGFCSKRCAMDWARETDNLEYVSD